MTFKRMLVTQVLRRERSQVLKVAFRVKFGYLLSQFGLELHTVAAVAVFTLFDKVRPMKVRHRWELHN